MPPRLMRVWTLSVASGSSNRSGYTQKNDRTEGQITIDGWARLQQLPTLTRLTLADSELTDAAIEPLGQCSGLIELQLASPHIHGEGLSHLGELKSLFDLRLDGCPVDTAGGLLYLESNTGPASCLAAEYSNHRRKAQ
jgi:hypothetical protein